LFRRGLIIHRHRNNRKPSLGIGPHQVI
jgi:hypothetical protein